MTEAIEDWLDADVIDLPPRVGTLTRELPEVR